MLFLISQDGLCYEECKSLECLDKQIIVNGKVFAELSSKNKAKQMLTNILELHRKVVEEHSINYGIHACIIDLRKMKGEIENDSKGKKRVE